MKNAKIFLVGEHEDKLTPMTETTYSSEDVLQVLLERYSDLLPGDQIDPEAPRRWLLVSREMSVPGGENEGGRWSLDHLFLDQDGIPTFVECKRASDTRARREAVAQMLDYAANGIEYWGMDKLRQAARETASNQGASLDEAIGKLLERDDASIIENYWQRVESNLRSGKVRLLFVTDETPRELRRLVEFLNEKMADVEVMAVEIKQFVGKGQKALVPRVIGLTEKSREVKGGEKAPKLNRTAFLNRCKPPLAKFFERVLDQAEKKGHRIYWGTVCFSVGAWLEDGSASFLYCYPDGEFDFYFSQLSDLFDAETLKRLRKELLDFGVFREAGKQTLKADVEETNIPKMQEVYDFILNKIGEIVETH
jgi:hypothetical protein